jgi:hypothetical protein
MEEMADTERGVPFAVVIGVLADSLLCDEEVSASSADPLDGHQMNRRYLK